jgi:hypothetical protein
MQQIPINWWAVIVAALIRIAVGFIWYSPFAFLKPWQGMTGVTQETMRAGTPKAVGIDVAMSLIMAFALANIVGASGITDWVNGALAGFWVWLGFVFTSFFVLWAYENRPLQLVAINTGHNLVALILMGALLAGWR